MLRQNRRWIGIVILMVPIEVSAAGDMNVADFDL
jgi:hypothetical protein